MSHDSRLRRSTLRLAALLALAGAVALPTGCASTFTPACRVGADCASGKCLPDGTCAQDDGGSAPDGAAPDGTTAPDGPATPDGGVLDGAPPSDAGGDGAPVSCTPNLDGVITRAELPLRAGLHATFKVAQDVTVDTAGTTQGSDRVWDFTAALTGDHALLNETRELAGTWFASTFAGATYAARLSDAESLLGVFEVTDAALLLRGVVSPEDGLYRTELTYDPPVKVLAFPLQASATYTTDSTVTGYALGVYGFYSEKYESQVDASGVVKTPYADFKALRVNTRLTRTVGYLVTTTRTFAFVTECFGSVATVRSQDDESTVEFTDAAEVWRLTP